MTPAHGSTQLALPCASMTQLKPIGQFASRHLSVTHSPPTQVNPPGQGNSPVPQGSSHMPITQVSGSGQVGVGVPVQLVAAWPHTSGLGPTAPSHTGIAFLHSVMPGMQGDL